MRWRAYNIVAPVDDSAVALARPEQPLVLKDGADRRWPDGGRVGVWVSATVFFLLLPFALLSWLLPFVSRLTIGNDYPLYALLAQLDVMWSVAKGTFPLYMPGFAGGHSTAAMTQAQLYHPISWLASLMPGYWSGLALEWNTCLRLLSLGLVHLVLYGVCRRLAMGRLTAFLCAFPVVYNLRMLDSFRYGASLESYTGTLLVVGFGALVSLDPGSKGKVVLLAVATYMTVVSGHPQWAFLGMLGAISFLGVFPWLARTIHPGLPLAGPGDVARYCKRIGIGLTAGVLLAAPYVLTFFFEFYRTNHGRVSAHDYDWTLGFSASLGGEWANFFSPFHADVHGAFAGSAPFLVAAMLPLVFVVKRPPVALLVTYMLGLLAFAFALGGLLPLHRLVTEMVPLFGSFRTPGRILIWLPIVVLPILAWLLRPSNRQALGVASAGAFLTYLLAVFKVPKLTPGFEGYSPHWILGDVIPPYFDSLFMHLSGATILFLLLAAVCGRKRRYCFAASLACTLATTWLCLSAGTWKQEKVPTYVLDNMDEDRTRSPVAHSAGNEGFGLEMRAVAEYTNRGLKPQRPLGVIVHGAASASSDDEVLQQLKAGRASQTVFIDGPVQPRSDVPAADYDTVSLDYNTSNRFRFNVVAGRDGYFILGLPLLPGFVCRVDGSLVKVAKADALYPSVFLPRGFHVVDFSFVSWPFLLGAVMAFAALGGLIAWVAGRKRRSWVTRGMLAAALPLAFLLCVFLYGGPSFNTNYFWQVRL